MSYKSILLNLGIDGPIEPLTRVAIELAKHFDARLIGFCAADAPRLGARLSRPNSGSSRGTKFGKGLEASGANSRVSSPERSKRIGTAR